MKKTNIFKIEYIFNEISAEFDFDTLNIMERGIFISIFHAYRNYVNAGYVGIPYSERYEITKSRTKKEKLQADEILQKYFYLVEDKNNKKTFRNDYLFSIFGE